MAIKTIQVCLTGSRHADTLMRIAVPLAARHNALLVGVHTIEALVVYPGIAMHIPDQAFGAFNESQAREAAEIEEIFERHCNTEDFPCEWRLLRAEAVSAAERIVESARAADLVIMAQADKTSDRYDQRNVQERVIRESGRPVLVVPLGYDGPPVGQRILLGWTNSREAARAAHDVVSMAAPDADVNVVQVGGPLLDEMTEFDALAIAGMYARHGLRATVTHCEADGSDVAPLLVTTARRTDADMIATGAFGHSRFHDFVVGSVTWSLLHDAELPVLFSC